MKSEAASAAEALPQRRETVTLQVGERGRSSRTCEHDRLARAFDGGTAPGRPVYVGRSQCEAGDVLLRVEQRVALAVHEVERASQPFLGDRARLARRTADVLVVHEMVEEPGLVGNELRDPLARMLRDHH